MIINVFFFRFGSWRKGKIIFIGKSVIDVALVQLLSDEIIECCTVDFNATLTEGNPILALGHGVWGSNHSMIFILFFCCKYFSF